MKLAALYQQQSRFEEAKALQDDTLAGMKAHLGEGHPHVVQCMINQAETFASMDRFEEAVSLLDSMARTLSRNDQRSLQAKTNLASRLVSLDRPDDATTLLREVMEVQRNNLPSMFLGLLYTMAEVAAIYLYKGEWRLAEQTSEAVLRVMNRELGANHPNLIAYKKNLALALQKQGQHAKAKNIYLALMDQYYQTYGKAHIETFDCKYDKALDLGRELANLAEGVLGKPASRRKAAPEGDPRDDDREQRE
ncbi:hypothetical protein FSARC_9106 [Fusarium sarcochroum]|uniref:Kinesin light chain n=1 Tax=Fusarium sarcochroum TaxID=1208366 RepID=A0A8H4X5M9_9HYPO|nr:hypothetical protein FSARC_9106 [Fusarium sarcochroum]